MFPCGDDSYGKLQQHATVFFLTHQPPATKQAQNPHFFFKFSAQEGIFVICLQTDWQEKAPVQGVGALNEILTPSDC